MKNVYIFYYKPEAEGIKFDLTDIKEARDNEQYDKYIGYKSFELEDEVDFYTFLFKNATLREREDFALLQKNIVDGARLFNYAAKDSSDVSPLHYNCTFHLYPFDELGSNINEIREKMLTVDILPDYVVKDLSDAGNFSNDTLKEVLDGDSQERYVFIPRYIKTQELNGTIYNEEVKEDKPYLKSNKICTLCYAPLTLDKEHNFRDFKSNYEKGTIKYKAENKEFQYFDDYWDLLGEIVFNKSQNDMSGNLSFQYLKEGIRIISNKSLPYTLSEYQICPRKETYLYDVDEKYGREIVLDKLGELENYDESSFGSFRDGTIGEYFGGMYYIFATANPVRIKINYEPRTSDLEIPKHLKTVFTISDGSALTDDEYNNNILALFDFCSEKNYLDDGFFVRNIEGTEINFKAEFFKDATELWNIIDNMAVDGNYFIFTFKYHKQIKNSTLIIKYSLDIHNIFNISEDFKNNRWSVKRDGKYYDEEIEKTITSDFSINDYRSTITEVSQNVLETYPTDIVKVLSAANLSYDDIIIAYQEEQNPIIMYVYFDCKSLKVSWYDRSQELIKEEEVLYGETAIEPEYSPGEDYVFIKWDKEFGEIKEDTDIHALCLPTWDYLTSLCDNTEKLDEVLSDMENTGLLSKEKLNKIQNNLIMVCTGYKPNDIPEIEGESGFTPFNPEGGSSNEEAAADSVINVKNLEIIFKPKKYLEETRRYVEDKLMPYITEMIPSTTIFRYKFEGDEPEVKQRKPYIGSKFED